MDLTITLIAIAVAIGAAVGSGWMGARPRDYTKPRRVPWSFLMLTFAAVVMVLGVHLLNVVGVSTGSQPR